MRALIVSLLTLLSVVIGFGQTDSVRVSLITFFPGSEIFELEGHTGLRIRDLRTHDDVIYNWGTFDFNSPGFVYRFVMGETDYTVAAAPTDLFLMAYEAQGRRIVEQELNLTPAETARLKALVDENMLPENRVYRYNYVLDNCATRPLAIVRRALAGDTLALAQAARPGHNTFRKVMRGYHRNYPWYQFGIDLALGSGIDRVIDNDARSFAPADLMTMVADADIVAADGSRRPLVGATKVLNDVPADHAVRPATPSLLTPAAVSWTVFAIALALSVADIRRRRLSAWFDVLFYSLCGLAGLLLTFLIFISVHEATSPNWLYLWLNPLCFIAAVGVVIKSAAKMVVSWQMLNFALLIILCGVGIAGVQSLNAAFWPLIGADMLRSITYIVIYRCNRSKKSS